MSVLFTATSPNDAGLKNVICSYELFVKVENIPTENDIPSALEPIGDAALKVPSINAYAGRYPVQGPSDSWD